MFLQKHWASIIPILFLTLTTSVANHKIHLHSHYEKNIYIIWILTLFWLQTTTQNEKHYQGKAEIGYTAGIGKKVFPALYFKPSMATIPTHTCL